MPSTLAASKKLKCQFLILHMCRYKAIQFDLTKLHFREFTREKNLVHNFWKKSCKTNPYYCV